MNLWNTLTCLFSGKPSKRNLSYSLEKSELNVVVLFQEFYK